MLVLTPGVSWYFVLQSNPIFAACEGVGTRSLLVSKKAGHGASRSSVAKHAPSTVEVEKSFYDSPSSDSPVGFLVLTRGDPLGRTSTVLLCILGPGQLHNSPLPLSTGTKRQVPKGSIPQSWPPQFANSNQYVKDGGREQRERDERGSQ